MIENAPRVLVFRKLVSEFGYEFDGPVDPNPFQWGEGVRTDGVVFSRSQDRGDVERRVSLGGNLGPYDFTLNGLLTKLGCTPSGSDDDFLVAAKLLDNVTIKRLTTNA